MSSFNKNEEGIALVLVLLLITLILVLGTSLLKYAISEVRFTTLDERQIKAHYLARSGADAIGSWLEDPANDPALILNKKSKDINFGAGSFQINNIKQNKGTFIIKASGKVKNTSGNREFVEQSVTLEIRPVFDFAVYSAGDISLKNNCSIIGDLRTNSTIIAENSATIDGNVFIEPDGILPEPDHITGQINRIHTTRNFSAPLFPDFPDLGSSNGDLILSNSDEHTINTDSYYSNIEINKDGILFIDTSAVDELKVTNLTINNKGTKGKIILIGDGQLKLYIENTIIVNGGAKLNPDNKTEALTIYYQGSDSLNFVNDAWLNGSIFIKSASLSLKNKFELTGHIISNGPEINIQNKSTVNTGVIYAPTATLNVSQVGEFKGMIISDQLNLSNLSQITYDPSTLRTFPFTEIQDMDSVYYRLWK